MQQHSDIDTYTYMYTLIKNKQKKTKKNKKNPKNPPKKTKLIFIVNNLL